MTQHFKGSPEGLWPFGRGLGTESPRVLSLDVFDTLLWRKLPRPEDLFLLLGQKLEVGGWLIDAVTPECFAELRQRAAGQARMKKAEVTLQEIYWELSGIFRKITLEQMLEGVSGIINESDVADLVAMEISLEKQMIEFDTRVLSWIHYAKEKGILVILVSNTYFDLQQLSDILGSSLVQSVDKIFSSCEYGCSKSEGLFFKVIEEIGESPESILHIGDDWVNDCLAARQAGIVSLYYPKYDKTLTKLLAKEWPEDSETRLGLLDPEQGDFGLSAMRGKMMHHPSVVALKKEELFFWKYGSQVLGPILTSFAHWVYARCQALGQTKVFCLMREGRLYANIIKQCASCYPEIIVEPKELWASRQFMIRACLYEANADELLAIIKTNPAVPYTGADFCASIGVEIQTIKKLAKYAHVDLDEMEFVQELIDHLSSQEFLKEKIKRTALIRRKNFLKYLGGIVDLSSASSLTLVDVGWRGTIQGALQMLLYREGYPISIHGLYLGTNAHTHLALLQGFIREGFLVKGGYPIEAEKAIARGAYVLEQVATAGLCPLVDFTEEGQVVTGKLSISRKQWKQVECMRSGIEAFCSQLNHYIQAQAIRWDSSSEFFARAIEAAIDPIDECSDSTGSATAGEMAARLP